MFDYNINKMADNKSFKKICEMIEQRFTNLKKEKLLIDVDGSSIQIYREGNKKIKVFNDYEVNSVYIESEINLNEIFEN